MIGSATAPRGDGEEDRSAGREEASQGAEVVSVEEARVETGKRPALTVEERALVEQAVQAAERTTSAEVVPMIVDRSGLYRDAGHRAGLTLAILALALLLTVETAWLPWTDAVNAVLALLVVI